MHTGWFLLDHCHLNWCLCFVLQGIVQRWWIKHTEESHTVLCMYTYITTGSEDSKTTVGQHSLCVRVFFPSDISNTVEHAPLRRLRGGCFKHNEKAALYLQGFDRSKVSWFLTECQEEEAVWGSFRSRTSFEMSRKVSRTARSVAERMLLVCAYERQHCKQASHARKLHDQDKNHFHVDTKFWSVCIWRRGQGIKWTLVYI